MNHDNMILLDKFKVGGRVVVTVPESIRYGRAATIVELRLSDVFKYRLLFNDGKNLGYNESEFELSKNQIIKDIIKDL